MIPRHVLLATDLSCRGDRAMDRAIALAAGWNASLTALHVLSEPDPVSSPSWRPRDRRALALRDLHADLHAAGARQFEVRVERGLPVPAILDTVDKLGCDLVVTGLPREETLERALLGTTLDGLARDCKVPVLVVKTRPKGPYRSVVVATDFSEGSRQALTTALALFPQAKTSLFHAFHIPFASRAGDTQSLHEAAEARAMEESRAFLADIPDRERIDTLSAWGDVGRELQRLIEERQVELVAVGTQGKGRLAELLLGNIARRLAAELTSDVLLVRERSAQP